MKKLLITLLISIMFLSSCTQSQPLQDSTLSTERVVWGDRIYSVQSIPEFGTYLAYTEIGDEEETVYVGCVDPLCSHAKDECTAYAGNARGPVALVPQKKGCIIYYYREESELRVPDNPSQGYVRQTHLMALDMQKGTCRIVTTLPWCTTMNDNYLLTDTHVYFTLNSAMIDNNYETQSVNIWRAPLEGGELEQITFAEDVMSGYRMEHYEDGVFYFRRGDTLCRTVDNFVTEETVMENLNLMWKIVFHGDWIYYTDKREVISVTPDEPMAENYTHVYDYMIGEYPDALDAANICTLMRVRNDGSGVMEELVSGVATCFNNTAANWCIVDNTLYCVPAKFELQGTYEWSDKLSPNSLSYIWSETGGELWAVDLETKEKHVVYADLGYDIQSITYTGKGKFLVCADIYEIDEIKAYYETHPITGSIDGYTEWKLIDIE